MPPETWLKPGEHLGLLETWGGSGTAKTDSFEEDDRGIREEEKFSKGRVKKSPRP